MQERLGVFQYQYCGVSVSKELIGDTPPRFFEISKVVRLVVVGRQMPAGFREVDVAGAEVLSRVTQVVSHLTPLERAAKN